MHFKQASINFGKNVEIKYLRSVSNKECAQIVAKDNVEMILYIVTWNFELDIETSMF